GAQCHHGHEAARQGWRWSGWRSGFRFLFLLAEHPSERSTQCTPQGPADAHRRICTLGLLGLMHAAALGTADAESKARAHRVAVDLAHLRSHFAPDALVAAEQRLSALSELAGSAGVEAHLLCVRGVVSLYLLGRFETWGNPLLEHQTEIAHLAGLPVLARLRRDDRNTFSLVAGDLVLCARAFE